MPNVIVLVYYIGCIIGNFPANMVIFVPTIYILYKINEPFCDSMEYLIQIPFHGNNNDQKVISLI
jgi:hypothetical protein